MNDLIYLDNAATTKLSPKAFDAMVPYLSEYYGNASGAYRLGAKSKAAIDHSRSIIAAGIGASPDEIYFTSGGSEADNWALKAAVEMARRNGHKSCHIITTAIEHHAILHTCAWLEQTGVKVSYISVNEEGTVNLEELEQAITPETVLISVMFANNEIGTIEPIVAIGEIAQRHGILFHTDAVQAYGHLPISVKDVHIDMLSASAHKLYGPKGIGFLYIKKGIKLQSFLHGGAQERQRRAGTENVAAIVGFGVASQEAFATMTERADRELYLREYLLAAISREIPDVSLNGHKLNRLTNNVNISFFGVLAETLLIILDMHGICASAGSACATGAREPSHVLKAIGLSDELAQGTLRLTLSYDTQEADLNQVVNILKNAVMKLRETNISGE